MANSVQSLANSPKEIFENYDHDKISDFLERRKNAIRENHSTGLKKREDVVGILNGIDYEIWNPEIDEYIYHKFDTKNKDSIILLIESSDDGLGSFKIFRIDFLMDT